MKRIKRTWAVNEHLLSRRDLISGIASASCSYAAQPTPLVTGLEIIKCKQDNRTAPNRNVCGKRNRRFQDAAHET